MGIREDNRAYIDAALEKHPAFRHYLYGMDDKEFFTKVDRVPKGEMRDTLITAWAKSRANSATFNPGFFDEVRGFSQGYLSAITFGDNNSNYIFSKLDDFRYEQSGGSHGKPSEYAKAYRDELSAIINENHTAAKYTGMGVFYALSTALGALLSSSKLGAGALQLQDSATKAIATNVGTSSLRETTKIAAQQVGATARELGVKGTAVAALELAGPKHAAGRFTAGCVVGSTTAGAYDPRLATVGCVDGGMAALFMTKGATRRTLVNTRKALQGAGVVGVTGLAVADIASSAYSADDLGESRHGESEIDTAQLNTLPDEKHQPASRDMKIIAP